MSSQYILIKIDAPSAGLRDVDLDGIRQFIKDSGDGSALICERRGDIYIHCCSFRSKSTMFAAMNALRDDRIIERRMGQRRNGLVRRTGSFSRRSKHGDPRRNSEERRHL